jgi:hypothetical protein
VRSIIGNPPYSDDLAEKFIRHALRLTEPVKGMVAMLARHEYDCAAGRVDLFDRLGFRMKMTLTKRPKWIEDSTGSPRHNYAWFVWDWFYSGHPILVWRPAGTRL